MSVPDNTRDQVRERLWRIADEIGWLALGPSDKTQYYDNWTKDPQVGGVLQRYMTVGQLRMYIKDTILKGYPSARRADQAKPFRMLGLPEDTPACVFIKPHGRRLPDGRIVCWGRAVDWKSVLMAVYERTYSLSGATPYAAILTECGGKFLEQRVRDLITEAAKRLGIERLVWDL